MNYTLFGSIKDPCFMKMNEDNQNKHLFESLVYIHNYSISTLLKHDDEIPGLASIILPLSNDNLTYIPTDELTDQFYSFILEQYEAFLKGYPVMFDIEFNNECFGVSEKKKRKLALIQFNEIFSMLFKKNAPIIDNRFKALKNRKDHLKGSLATQRNLVLEFLIGNRAKFNRKTFENNIVLQETIEFEGKLEILLHLNNTYKFELDYYFGETAALLEKYNTIQNPTFDFVIFLFIHNCITSIEKYTHSYVVSLYFFLKKHKLIQETADNFCTIINDQYELQIGAIKLSDDTNKEHEKRVNYYENKWNEYKK
ncbi:MAG: hypothetical protein COA50_00185 [Flavobacteriaceae bacterium]|nr:MAG: hypothetical protein COA50_00185 [Flavobacteriaceae bacterium]